MTETPLDILSPKYDFVFKRLFGDANHIAPLAAFLQAALGLPEEEFAEILIVDPNLNSEYDGDKHCVLDVRVKTGSGRDVDVEIQVKPSAELFNRIQCYTAKMVAGQVKAGESYRGMAQSICIVIVDFRLWEKGARYHHRFQLYDREAETAYPNSMEIHTLELPKIPKDSDGTALWNWLKFISSETREEFASLAGKDAVMAEAVARLMELSADEKARLRAEAREKWEWDNAARMRQSREEGLAEGRAEGRAKGRAEGRVEGLAEVARNMLRNSMPLIDIAHATGLSEQEIQRLATEEKR